MIFFRLLGLMVKAVWLGIGSDFFVDFVQFVLDLVVFDVSIFVLVEIF